MPYKITGHKPGATVRSERATAETALAEVRRMQAGGMICIVHDAETGEILSDEDLLDQIEEGYAPDA